MTRIAIISGSTRPHRSSQAAASWVLEVGQQVVPTG